MKNAFKATLQYVSDNRVAIIRRTTIIAGGIIATTIASGVLAKRAGLVAIPEQDIVMTTLSPEAYIVETKAHKASREAAETPAE
jgi:hypothetical protein